MREARAEGLDDGLLGGEALREEADRARRRGGGSPLEHLLFLGHQQPADEMAAEPRVRRLDARELDDIGADAVDHGRRASHISRFISRTASASPE